MELYIIRHGKTDWNATERLQGREDIELNEKGIAAAIALGKRLKGVHFDKIYSSPLRRAYQTAILIKGERNIPIIRDERLAEISFGVNEGTVYSDWIAGGSSFNAFAHSPENYVPPKGGESFQSVIERAKDFLKNVIEPDFSSNGRIMVVAHGVLNAGLTAAIESRPIEKFWAGGLFKNCEEKIYTFDGTKWLFGAKS